MTNGWLYLVAVMDWYSRYILSWELSNTLDTAFCVSALQAALEMGKPDIFNTDQGSQFTSNLFTSELLNRDIRVSMDGRGRAFDNIFIERFWRTVKYEESSIPRSGMARTITTDRLPQEPILLESWLTIW